MIRTSPFTTATAAARPVAGIDPSEGQINYLADLLAERNWADFDNKKYVSRAATISIAIDVATGKLSSGTMFLTAPFLGGKVNQALHQGKVDQLTKASASAMIDWLQGLPRKAASATANQVETPEVPAGRYAVATEDGATNELAFYKVDRPTEGRWAGFVFVKLMRSDEEVRLSRAAGNAILAKIAEVGAEEASKAYGREIGECGVCGRTLTNDDSRAMGIGPKCAEKF
ncbi:hypothetical protein FDJ57_gp45 [Gordonia phage Sour]|uniref:Uncharacterized protein n=1 Tax=Gordonia phage Sour TaxID=2182349 RepID=A0A2U8ULD4_9CAUD|nr:hypothetical protein FDJ57_gp45 [Gordonia phage Sour]AWN04246.1 hypothetical protein PBI_SOUR_45 [Gordonia phage Sour]